ncbi:PAS domain-containing protein [Mycolicibacterium sp. CBM1]
MDHDWLLVETLGTEPVVVAQGRQMKNLVPLRILLRRNPYLSAIQTAIAETVASAQSLASITPKSDRVIRTEPVRMPDGRMHGVHVWIGAADAQPPERPLPGPLKWDMTLGIATETAESLTNAGMDPTLEPTHGRAFAEDLPARSFTRDEAKVLALMIDAAPGRTYCTTWDFTDPDGNPIRAGFTVRTAVEIVDDGTQHVIARAMNLRCDITENPPLPEHLAKRILDGLTPPGAHRALVDLSTWRLLKWLDEPCPHFDWRQSVRFHPDDRDVLLPMTEEFETGSTSRVLRLPRTDGGWVPMHVTVNRVEVDTGVFAGLIAVRLPTAAELAEAGHAGATP